MSILLDFDMDFFVRPIYKESRDNHRDYINEPCELMDLEGFFSALESKNLHWTPDAVKLFTNHKKSYTLWWTRKYRNCTLVHIDAHSDFYRPKGRDLMSMGNHDITCYNYIWYAVRDGFVNRVYWVLPEDHELMLRLSAFTTAIESCGSSSDSVFPFILDLEKSDDSTSATLYSLGLDIIRNAIDIRMPKRGQINSRSITLECPVNTVNGELSLEIIICPVSELPSFSETIEMVTAATSPEFISAEADTLIPEFCKWIKATDEMCRNIQGQHEDMKASK